MQAPNLAPPRHRCDGSWVVTKADEGALPVHAVIDFSKDGKVKITIQSDGNTSSSEGTYTVAGDKLSVTLKHGDKEVKHAIVIKKLTETEYVSENEKGKVAEYKRKK
jgi:uncharacterized protein (TIGR03066 family)